MIFSKNEWYSLKIYFFIIFVKSVFLSFKEITLLYICLKEYLCILLIVTLKKKNYFLWFLFTVIFNIYVRFIWIYRYFPNIRDLHVFPIKFLTSFLQIKYVFLFYLVDNIFLLYRGLFYERAPLILHDLRFVLHTGVCNALTLHITLHITLRTHGDKK